MTSPTTERAAAEFPVILRVTLRAHDAPRSPAAAAEWEQSKRAEVLRRALRAAMVFAIELAGLEPADASVEVCGQKFDLGGRK